MRSDEFLNDAQLRKEILQHIKSGKYRISKHAAAQQAKRAIDMQDTLHILKNGTHERSKTLLRNLVWKYAIRGKTEDLQEVRVIIAFSDEMVIITVIDIL